MDIIFLVLRLISSVIIAIIVGKLIGKIKLPAILDFLITGMILGPYALNFYNFKLISCDGSTF